MKLTETLGGRDTLEDATGHLFVVHKRSVCDPLPFPCVLHSPSDHHMRSWPMIMRASTLIERLCEHGVGHPDPDSAAFFDRNHPEYALGVHGCCEAGCCQSPNGQNGHQSRREEHRKIATDFVRAINEVTYCNRCGSQPIEWHREEHEMFPNWRVSSLRTQGASVDRIRREMELSEPLCRSCHMNVDGRTDALLSKAPYQKGKVYVLARPCTKCGKPAKPTRKKMCWTCYEAQRPGGRGQKEI